MIGEDGVVFLRSRLGDGGATILEWSTLCPSNNEADERPLDFDSSWHAKGKGGKTP
jgi:hypothetical protein